MVWVNGYGCQRAYSYLHIATVVEMPVALRSLRPDSPIFIWSVYTSRIAEYLTRMSGGVGVGGREVTPYPYMCCWSFILFQIFP